MHKSPVATHQITDNISQVPICLVTFHIGKTSSYLLFLLEINFTANAEQGIGFSNNERKRPILPFYLSQTVQVRLRNFIDFITPVPS